MDEITSTVTGSVNAAAFSSTFGHAKMSSSSSKIDETATKTNSDPKTFSMIFTGDTVAFNSGNNDTNDDDNATTTSSTLFLSTTSQTSPDSKSGGGSVASSPVRKNSSSPSRRNNSPGAKSFTSPFSDRDVNESHYLESAHFLDATAPLLVMSPQSLQPKTLDHTLAKQQQQELEQKENQSCHGNNNDKQKKMDITTSSTSLDSGVEDEKMASPSSDDEDDKEIVKGNNDEKMEDQDVDDMDDDDDHSSSSSSLASTTDDNSTFEEQEADDDDGDAMLFTQAFDTQDEDYLAMPPPSSLRSPTKKTLHSKRYSDDEESGKDDDDIMEEEYYEKQNSKENEKGKQAADSQQIHKATKENDEKAPEKQQQEKIQDKNETSTANSTVEATTPNESALSIEKVPDTSNATTTSDIATATDGATITKTQNVTSPSSSTTVERDDVIVADTTMKEDEDKNEKHKKEQIISATTSNTSSTPKGISNPSTTTTISTASVTSPTADDVDGLDEKEKGKLSHTTSQESTSSSTATKQKVQGVDRVLVTPGLTTVKKVSKPQDAVPHDSSLGKGRTLDYLTSSQQKVKQDNDPNTDKPEGYDDDGDEEEEEEVPTQVMSVGDEKCGSDMFDNGIYGEDSQLSLSLSMKSNDNDKVVKNKACSSPASKPNSSSSSSPFKSSNNPLMCLTSNTTTTAALSMSSETNHLFYNGSDPIADQLILEDDDAKLLTDESQTQLELIDKMMTASNDKTDTVAKAVVTALEDERNTASNDKIDTVAKAVVTALEDERNTKDCTKTNDDIDSFPLMKQYNKEETNGPMSNVKATAAAISTVNMNRKDTSAHEATTTASNILLVASTVCNTTSASSVQTNTKESPATTNENTEHGISTNHTGTESTGTSTSTATDTGTLKKFGNATTPSFKKSSSTRTTKTTQNSISKSKLDDNTSLSNDGTKKSNKNSNGNSSTSEWLNAHKPSLSSSSKTKKSKDENSKDNSNLKVANTSKQEETSSVAKIAVSSEAKTGTLKLSSEKESFDGSNKHSSSSRVLSETDLSLRPLEDTQEEEDSSHQKGSSSSSSSFTRLKKMTSIDSCKTTKIGNTTKSKKNVSSTSSAVAQKLSSASCQRDNSNNDDDDDTVVEEETEEEESPSQWDNEVATSRSKTYVSKESFSTLEVQDDEMDDEATAPVEMELSSFSNHHDNFAMTQEEESMLRKRNERRLKLKQQQEALRQTRLHNEKLQKVFEIKEVKELCTANQSLKAQVATLQKQVLMLTNEKTQLQQDVAKWKRKCQYTIDENDTLKQELDIANELKVEHERQIQTIIGASSVGVTTATNNAIATTSSSTSAKKKSKASSSSIATNSSSSSKKKSKKSSSVSSTKRKSGGSLSSDSKRKSKTKSLVYDEHKNVEMIAYQLTACSSKKSNETNNNDESDDDTLNNNVHGEVSSESSLSQETRIDFEGYWQQLKEHGWKYRSGPEPYNQVYVPPGIGSVKMGSKNNEHFFTDYDKAIQCAVTMGHIEMSDKQKRALFHDGTTSTKTSKKSKTSVATTSKPSSKNTTSKKGQHHHQTHKVVDMTQSDDSNNNNNDDVISIDDGSIMDVETVYTSKEDEEQEKEMPYIPMKCDNKSNEGETEGTQPSSSQTLVGGNSSTSSKGWFVPEALQRCLQIIFKYFLYQNDDGGQHFISEVWKPIWYILQNQHDYLTQDNTILNKLGNVNWKYLQSSRKLLLLGSSWIYGVPNTRGVKIGMKGIDYFIDEKQVIECMLNEIDTSKLWSSNKFQHAVYQCARAFCISDSSNDANNNTNIAEQSTTTTSRRKRSRTPSNKLVAAALASFASATGTKSRNSNSKEKEKDKTDSVVDDDHEKKKKQKMHHSTTTSSSTGGAMANKTSTPPTGATSTTPLPTYHLTQSPITSANKETSIIQSRQDAILASAVKRQLNKPIATSSSTNSTTDSTESANTSSPSSENKKVLDGMVFLISGCPGKIEAQVIKLGGLCITSLDVDGMSMLDRKVIGGKVCFLSAPQYRRRPKYLLAVALGLPMFHYKCLEYLQQQEDTYQREIKKKKQGGEEEDVQVKRPALFDTTFYKKWRLPTGIGSTKTGGTFVMQRARDASRWAPPGFEQIKKSENESTVVEEKHLLDNISIALALDDEDNEQHWMKMIVALGGTLVSKKKIREGTSMPTIVLMDSLTLPPHVTAIPSRVENVLKHVRGISDTKVLDLSWLIQCMIERIKLPYDSYICNISSSSSLPNQSLMSIKIQDNNNNNNISGKKASSSNSTPIARRYQIGDTVKVQLMGGAGTSGNSGGTSQRTSFARILRIQQRNNNQFYVTIRLLELSSTNTATSELIDNGNEHSVELETKASNLSDHIILLKMSEYKVLEYTKYNTDNIYVLRKRKMTPSQMI